MSEEKDDFEEEISSPWNLSTAKFFYELLRRPWFWLFLVVGFIAGFALSLFGVLFLAQIVVGGLDF